MNAPVSDFVPLLIVSVAFVVEACLPPVLMRLVFFVMGILGVSAAFGIRRKRYQCVYYTITLRECLIHHSTLDIVACLDCFLGPCLLTLSRHNLGSSKDILCAIGQPTWRGGCRVIKR